MISDKEKALLKLIENEPLALDEFKSIQKEVLELLNEKNPYAIYCSVSFPNIIWNGTDPSQLPYREINALKSKVKYEKGNIKIKNEKEIFDYYGELCKNQKNTEELKAKIWNCLPPKVLAVIKKYHEQNGKKESLTTSERSFHNEASDILAKRINELSNLEKEIKAKKNNAGKEELYQLLTGKEWSESIRENIHKMLIADPKTSFSEEFAKKVFENCGNKDSLVLYCEELLDSNNINPLIVSDFFSSGLAEEASGIAKRMFNALVNGVINTVIVKTATLPISGRIGINSTILNHQLKYVSPIINNPTKSNAKINLYGETNNFEFSLFLDLESVNISESPEMPVAITHNVE